MAAEPSPEDASRNPKWERIREKLSLLGGMVHSWAAKARRFLATSAARIHGFFAAQSALHPRLYFEFQALFSVPCLLWWYWPPAPGKAVLVLAVVAAIMTMQPKMTDSHRVGWLLIIFVLFLVESRSIDHDRYLHDMELAKARAEETKNFQGIASGITQAIQESQRQFNATMKRSDQVVRLQVNALNGLSTNLNTLTGENSFCYLAFVPSQQDLMFIHIGQFPLYGVSARIVELDNSNKVEPEHLMGITISIGDVIQHHASIQPLPSGVGSAPDHFNANIFFTARNGDWTELLREQLIKDKWVKAMRILVRFTFLKKERAVCETIDPEFPKQRNGNIDDDFRSLSSSKLPLCQ